MKSRTLLMVADSEKDANMLYATGLFVPDPFVWLRHGGRSTILVSDLEIDRARRLATVDRVLAWSDFRKRLEKQGVRSPSFHQVLAEALRQFGVRSATVPSNFPLGLALRLRRAGVRLHPTKDGLFPQRECKRPREVARIQAALRIAQTGMAAGIALLRRSRIGRDGFLRLGGRTLTSELVRAEMDIACRRDGGVATHTIVAGGNQGCDPHERGHGPLRANESIILDLFPRDERTGYFGDLTRTVVRGRAAERIREMYAAVREGQRVALRQIRAGVDGQVVHRVVCDFFSARGFPTGQRKGRMVGFFHGTGHGLGLDIHELPTLGPRRQILKAGHVVTVEPGLYYWGTGAVRIEDVALVTRRGHRLLSSFPYELEI